MYFMMLELMQQKLYKNNSTIKIIQWLRLELSFSSYKLGMVFDTYQIRREMWISWSGTSLI